MTEQTGTGSRSGPLPPAGHGGMTGPRMARAVMAWLQVCLLAVTVFLAGCHPAGPGGYHSAVSLSRGYAAFSDRDWKRARAVFTRLCRSGDKTVAWKANYALALTAVMEAETIAETTAAMQRWERLRQAAGGRLQSPEARMLETVLARLYARHGVEGFQGDCQAALRRKNEEAEKLRRQVRIMQHRIGLLEKKIEAIEEIDQKIQQKKHLSSPGSRN